MDEETDDPLMNSWLIHLGDFNRPGVCNPALPVVVE